MPKYDGRRENWLLGRELDAPRFEWSDDFKETLKLVLFLGLAVILLLFILIDRQEADNAKIEVGIVFFAPEPSEQNPIFGWRSIEYIDTENLLNTSGRAFRGVKLGRPVKIILRTGKYHVVPGTMLYSEITYAGSEKR